jgi:hypothetical protein
MSASLACTADLVAHEDRVHLERGERLRELVVQLARDAALLLLAHAGGFGGEGGELAFGLQALGDVAQDHGVDLAGRRRELRDRGLDRELLAVRAQAVHHRAARAHAARGHAGLAEAAHVARVLGAVALRHQFLEGFAEHLGGRPAEDLLGGAVVQHDALLFVHGQDPVHGRVEQARQAGFGGVGRGGFGRHVADYSTALRVCRASPRGCGPAGRAAARAPARAAG